jgi:hypothetical protein
MSIDFIINEDFFRFIQVSFKEIEWQLSNQSQYIEPIFYSVDNWYIKKKVIEH